jgi:hypothetical protein
MRWLARIALVATCAVSAMGSARGEEPAYIEASPDELTEAYGEQVAKRVFSDELTAMRKQLIKAGGLDQSCAADPQFVLRDVYPIKGAEADAAWIERYDVACEETLRRSAFLQMKDDKFYPMALLPGATIADYMLQADALNIVSTAAVTRIDKECNEASVTDTAVSQPPEGAGQAWKERWSVNACGELQEIDVDFTPSPQGGTDISVTNEPR